MRLKDEFIAKKYAQALLNLYENILDDRCFKSLLTLDYFFKANKHISVYLSIPTITTHIKEQVLSHLFEKLHTCKTIKLLVKPLVEHRRLEIFSSIVYQIIKHYRIRKNILLFNVTSSHELSSDQKKILINSLENLTKANVSVKFSIDSKLIIGIKVLGANRLWESSFAKKLRNIEQTLFQQVEL
jgi:ATP synthase F1 delta subunit